MTNKKNGWVFCFMFQINIVGQQVICSVNVNIQSYKETDKIKGIAFAKLRCFHGFKRYYYIENRIKWFGTLHAFSHTWTLEIYHALYNKWAPKSKHFSYLGMVMRSQFTVLDFKSGCDLEQAKKKVGRKYPVGFLKITEIRSSKSIKAKKDNFYLKQMVHETCAASKTVLPIPVIP